jgi:predicted dithiol-disulfide oxidoreductase (DUF899 family)
MSPRVVSAAEWVAARKELQAAEEEAVRRLEQIAVSREMSAVGSKDYVFGGLAARRACPTFRGRTQLIMQHAMATRRGRRLPCLLLPGR